MHSVHLSNLEPHEVRQLSRLRITGRDLIEPPPTHRSPLVRAFRHAALPLVIVGCWLVLHCCLQTQCGHHFQRRAPQTLIPSNACRWWRSWAVPGMGMFVEAWMVFAIG